MPSVAELPAGSDATSAPVISLKKTKLSEVSGEVDQEYRANC